MVVNIKLAKRFELDQASDTVLRRTWAGWDPDVTDQELWDHNRGRYRFSDRVDGELWATLSFGGEIRVVAELTDAADLAPRPGKTGDYWALVGHVLGPGQPAYDALIGTAPPRGRVVGYLPDPEALAPMAAYLLTHNPDKWDMEPEQLSDWIDATSRGLRVEGRWSTGARIGDILAGDRAFLLRQGSRGRGIVASGRFVDGEVYEMEHWEKPGSFANYADVEWDTVLDPDDRLDLATLHEAFPTQHWSPQISGTAVKGEVLWDVEQLWRDHVSDLRADQTSATNARSGGQGRMTDHERRVKIENAAQDRLMERYRDEGFNVVDMRVGNSFDARATRGDEVVYLEAKGTTTGGESVIVTRGEVAWARMHPGQCVLGVLSGVRFDAAEEVDPSSGSLDLFDWLPDDDELEPRQFDWSPSETKHLES